MSYQNYGEYQPGQPGQPDNSNQGAPNPAQQQEGGMASGPMDNSQSGFQPGNVGEPNSAGGSGGDMKTTLW